VGERGKTATGKIPGIPPYKYSTACELDTETDKIITCSSIQQQQQPQITTGYNTICNGPVTI